MDFQIRIRACKGADLVGDIDVPTTLPPHVRLRRLRPVHDGTDHWLWDLGRIFSEEAEEEAIEGEAFLYVQSWYIDHIRHPTCRRPRPIRLESQSVTWIDDFRHEWRDLLDQGVFFSLYVIKPRPPQFRHRNYACHVLIEQNRHRGQAAGVLTALSTGHTQDGMIKVPFQPRDIFDNLISLSFCKLNLSVRDVVVQHSTIKNRYT